MTTFLSNVQFRSGEKLDCRAIASLYNNNELEISNIIQKSKIDNCGDPLFSL